MAMPAPLAAPSTPLYRLAMPAVIACRFWPGVVAPAGGTSWPNLLSPFTPAAPDAAPDAAALGGLACSRTLRVSRGWMVLWDSARARAPASTSDAGFSWGLGFAAARLAVVARLLVVVAVATAAQPLLPLPARLASVEDSVRLAAVPAALTLLLLWPPPLRPKPGMPGRGSRGTGMPGRGSRGMSLRGPHPPRLLPPPPLPGLMLVALLSALLVSMLLHELLDDATAELMFYQTHATTKQLWVASATALVFSVRGLTACVLPAASNACLWWCVLYSSCTVLVHVSVCCLLLMMVL